MNRPSWTETYFADDHIPDGACVLCKNNGDCIFSDEGHVYVAAFSSTASAEAYADLLFADENEQQERETWTPLEVSDLPVEVFSMLCAGGVMMLADGDPDSSAQLELGAA